MFRDRTYFTELAAVGSAIFFCFFDNDADLDGLLSPALRLPVLLAPGVGLALMSLLVEGSASAGSGKATWRTALPEMYLLNSK
jgi:hypothetical protein